MNEDKLQELIKNLIRQEIKDNLEVSVVETIGCYGESYSEVLLSYKGETFSQDCLS